MEDVVVVCTIGKPGAEESAKFSPLDRGDCIDVGAIIAEEVEENGAEQSDDSE